MKATKVKILMYMAKEICKLNISQREAARQFQMTQKRLWEIMNIKYEAFRLETLIEYAERLGLKVEFDAGFCSIYK